jgi:hypothetical protein
MANLIISVLALIVMVAMALAMLNLTRTDQIMEAADARTIANGLDNYIRAGRVVSEVQSAPPTSLEALRNITDIQAPPIPGNGQWVIHWDSVNNRTMACASYPPGELSQDAIDQISSRFSPDAVVDTNACGIRERRSGVGVIIWPSNH